MSRDVSPDTTPVPAAPWRRVTALCIVLAAAMLSLDFITGPIIQFPVSYILPVAYAAWFGRGWLAYALAAGLPLARVGFAVAWDVPWSPAEIAINCVIRVAVLLFLALLTRRVAERTVTLKEEVSVLMGLLPICSFCKSIRDTDGTWFPIEAYISEHSRAEFSHGLCPNCLREHYGDLVGDTDEERPNAPK